MNIMLLFETDKKQKHLKHLFYEKIFFTICIEHQRKKEKNEIQNI